MKIKYKDTFNDDRIVEKSLYELLEYENMPYHGNDISRMNTRIENSNRFSIALLELLHSKGVLSEQDVCSICSKIVFSIDQDSFKIIK